MNRKASSGQTLLDIAKNSVDAFIKYRQRDPTSRTDRYMLLTTDSPYNIKVDWETSKTMDNFYREMRNLSSTTETNLGEAITKSFDLLNVHRAINGIDNYGQGRLPWLYDFFSMVILVTDGEIPQSEMKRANISRAKKFSNSKPTSPVANFANDNLINSFKMKESKFKIYELTKDPYRWDQRLFTLVLKVPSEPVPFKNRFSTPAPIEHQMSTEHQHPLFRYDDSNSTVPFDKILNSPANPLTTVTQHTGGHSYFIDSKRKMTQSIEHLVQKIQCGVIVHFKTAIPRAANQISEALFTQINQKLKPDTRKMLILKTKVNSSTAFPGHWPIPETFLPDVASNNPNRRELKIPLRRSHPMISLYCVPKEQLLIQNFAFDKYELENSDFSRQIIEILQTHSGADAANACFYVYILGCDGRNVDYNNIYDKDGSNSSGPKDSKSQNLFNNTENQYQYLDLKTLPPPFGYIKPNSNLTGVNLFVMPYDFPVLLPLIDKLMEKIRSGQALDYSWRKDFDSYIKRCPVYYIKHLKAALKAIQAPADLINENIGRHRLPLEAEQQLREMRVMAQKEAQSWRRHLVSVNGNDVRDGPPSNVKQSVRLKSILGEDEFLYRNFGNFSLQQIKPSRRCYYPYLDPYHIPRSDLLNQLTRMRRNVHAILTQHQLVETAEFMEIRRSKDISQMGNFEDRMKSMVPPLREVKDKVTTVRQKTFGNPFKRKSVSTRDNNQISYDEGIDEITGEVKQGPGAKKKRMPMTFSQWKEARKSEGGVPKVVGPRERYTKLYNQDLDTEVQNFTENSIDFNEAIPGRNDSPEGFNQISRSTADSGISSENSSVKTLFKPTAGLGVGRLGLSAGPISQNIKNVEKFKISIQNIKKLIRQPGNNHVLKSRIKREMGVFKCDIVMERKLIEATIALACEFKRNVIIDYFMNLIRIYEERDKLRFNEFLLFIFLWPGLSCQMSKFRFRNISWIKK